MGNLEVGLSTGYFERWMKGYLGMEHLSLKRLSAEGLWGGLLYRGPPKDMLSKALAWASFFRRCSALGEHGGTVFFGTLR
jgi:hypothetical protein